VTSTVVAILSNGWISSNVSDLCDVRDLPLD
jgi:hypothetical protein